MRHSTQQLWLLLLLLLRGWDRQEWPWVCVCVDGRAWLRASVRVRGGKRWGGGAQAGHAASRDARTLVMGALSLRVPGLAAACECCGAVRARSGNKAPSQSSLPACLPRAQARCVRACCALDCVDGPTTAKACPKRCASRQHGDARKCLEQGWVCVGLAWECRCRCQINFSARPRLFRCSSGLGVGG